MIKRILLEGAPGGGKTSLLFGRCDEDEPSVRKPCLADLGYVIFKDSIRSVFDQMRGEGKNPMRGIEESLRRIFELEISNYLSAKEGVYFFDRGIPGYGAIINKIKTMVNFPVNFPEYFHDYCCKHRYSNPVIFLEPIPDFDLSKPLKGGEPARRFTLEERQKMHEDFRYFYDKYGYDIVTIPKMSDNRDEDLRLKREKVLTLLDKIE